MLGLKVHEGRDEARGWRDCSHGSAGSGAEMKPETVSVQMRY